MCCAPRPSPGRAGEPVVSIDPATVDRHSMSALREAFRAAPGNSAFKSSRCRPVITAIRSSAPTVRLSMFISGRRMLYAADWWT